MNLRFVANLALVSAVASGVACSASGDPSSKNNTTEATGATSSTGAQPPLNTGGGPVINTGGSAALPMDPNDPRNVPVRAKTCDANGVCTCLRLALVGSLDSSANTKDTKPFIDWLNGKSGGTATVTMVATKPTMDAAFLAMYDILVLANVNTWKFSADEKAAVEAWVKTGGGIVTLTGFTSNATETADTSQLVDFAGMGYTGTTMGEWTAPGLPTGQVPTSPIYYKGGSVDMRNCLFRRSSMIDKDAGNTWAVKFAPQAAPLDKLTLGLDYVGAYIGWPVKAPPGSTVLATDSAPGGKNMAVALEVDGKGRILSFGDEWVVLANLWQPISAFESGGGTGDMCYLAPVGTETDTYHSVKSLYQSKQFWFDVINWVAPPSECNFTIEDPDVVVK